MDQKQKSFTLSNALRWTLTLALLAVMTVAIYRSPFYTMVSRYVAAPQPHRPRCEVEASLDFDHRAALTIPGLENLKRGSRNIAGAMSLVQTACAKDPSLKVIYLRQACGDNGARLSRTIYCR